MPLSTNPLGILSGHLVEAYYGACFNSLIRDSKTKPLPSKLFFDAQTFGFQSHLRIPVEDVLGHLGDILTVTHEERPIMVHVPGAGDFLKSAKYHEYLGLSFNKGYKVLSEFLSRLMKVAGQSALAHPIHIMHQLSIEEADAAWPSFMAELDLCTSVFKAHPDMQAEGAALMHGCLASQLLILSSQGPLRQGENAEADRLQLGSEERKTREQIADKRELAVARVAQVFERLMQMYWIYHFEGFILPGATDPPIWRLLPPNVREGLRRGRRQPAVHPTPAILPPIDEAQRRQAEPPRPAQPQVSAELEALAGLVEVQPGDSIWEHPRVLPYAMEFRAKKVYRTRFFRRDDYLLIPLPPDVTGSGQCVIALISLHDGHAADYFFLAGRPGDSPRSRLRWTKLVKYSRQRLLAWIWKRLHKGQKPSQIYIGREFHDKENPQRHHRRVRARLARN